MDKNKFMNFIAKMEKEADTNKEVAFHLAQMKKEMGEYERSRGWKKETCRMGVEYYHQVLCNLLP